MRNYIDHTGGTGWDDHREVRVIGDRESGGGDPPEADPGDVSEVGTGDYALSPRRTAIRFDAGDDRARRRPEPRLSAVRLERLLIGSLDRSLPRLWHERIDL